MTHKFSLPALASALSCAGLGLFLWLGISVALLQGRSGDMVLLRYVQNHGLILALLLVGFAFVTLRPAVADAKAILWRRLSIAALAVTLAAAVAVLFLLMRRPPLPGWTALAATLLSAGALAAVLALGMLTAASGQPGWRRQMVVPAFLGYALLAGASLLFAVLAVKWPGQGLLATPAPSLITLIMVVASSKFLYWFENGGMRAPVAGLSDQQAWWSRVAVLAFSAGLPLLLTLILMLWPQLAPRAGWCLVALSILAGSYLERHLLAMEAQTARSPA